jgi:glutaredoxin 3
MKQNIFIFLLIGILGFLGYYAYETYRTPRLAEEGVTQGPQKIKQRVPVVMYSMSTCRYCVMAKGLLERKGVQVEVKDIANNAHHAEMAQRTNNARSVPQIFIGAKHIGGYSELVQLDQGQQLAALLLGQSIHD